MKPGESHLDRRIIRFAILARAVLWVEALTAAFWPALTLVGAFAILALFGVPSALPVFLHVLLLIAFVLGLAAAVRLGWRHLSLPGPDAAQRRVERDSALRHRPFETLIDRPAGGSDAASGGLWRLHQMRQRRQIGPLRLSMPQAGLPERDPRALRYFVLIALVLGLIIAGPRTGRLIVAALVPHFGSSTTVVPVEAWIKPPAYTGLGPILLKVGSDAPVAVPIGSTLEAHVTGGSKVPRLVLGDLREDFKHVDGGGFVLTRAISAPGTLSIRRGWFTLSQWRIDVIPDQLPAVAFAHKPSAMQSGALKLDYHATDDYGVAGIDLRVRRPPGQPEIVAEPIAASLASGQNAKDLRGSSFQDLTAHPWAGMQVLAKLVATDTAGQTNESPEILFTLPERRFTNATAQTIIAVRKHVIMNDAPRMGLVLTLSNLSANPQVYAEDLSVFLALRSATFELNHLRRENRVAVADIEDLLWNAALKIEDGNRPEAEKALRAAEDALEKALKDPNTPASEIARLTQNLKDAMNRDIQAMAENMRNKQARGEQPESSPSDPNTQTIDQKDLNNQVDKLSQMAQNGSRDAAQDMLDYIKSLLENMKAGDQAGKANEQGKKSLQDLKDLAKKQRNMENGTDPNSAENQEQLRQSLGDAARKIGESMGDIPESMGNADRAMRNATKALKRGTQGGAKGDQEEAAGQLDQAAKSLSDQLSQDGPGQTELKGDGKGDRDPLGRAKFDTGRGVKVPTDREMQRSREILDELRKRAGEHDRPRSELDYLRRLLQQY
ncbi:MAG: hypothetical protein JWM91_2066 [Rhodospirillales bacterium]|nr:hypothetical protein [Rhodospirillales bacterium]